MTVTVVSLILLASGALTADIVEPEDCASFPCMIFEDNFDYLDNDIWEHEITMSGGGVSLSTAEPFFRNDDFGTLGNQYGGTTLHWGPFWPYNFFEKTHAEYSANTSSFADDFHVWRLDWTKDNMEFYVDDVLQLTIDPGNSFWDFAGMGPSFDNPWAAGDKMAPFDQKFYLILNVAVGGTNGFFPDGIAPKPWSNLSPTAFLDFWNARDEWLPSWKAGEDRISEGAAMQVDYVRVWKMESTEQ
ncbi:beta-1,3-glucan-binding protein-like [Penaeus chinensis]|uniref:beta-1,3-glucan-binding protein-like n=1 Tax=Penaeus chinensis TaxID=139456 RepID=UPI001FB69527|nr:beta-1,3-glucan-binding protein-like [Penaeus chinensis]